MMLVGPIIYGGAGFLLYILQCLANEHDSDSNLSKGRTTHTGSIAQICKLSSWDE